MAFNVTDFKQAMVYDGARPNLFKVVFGGSSSSSFFSPGSDFEMFCRATSIPGATIGQVVVPYFGREVKFAGNRTFADWTVTVINDEDFKVRSVMEKWMDGINKHTANRRAAFGSVGARGYYASATVHQLGKSRAGNTTRSYTFQNLFPVDLSEITLDWGDNDSIQEFTVTFAYDYWTASTGTGNPVSANPIS